MSETLEERASKLLLAERVAELRRSVHPCGCEEGKKGDSFTGEELAERIGEHLEKIRYARDLWYEALQYYHSVRKQKD